MLNFGLELRQGYYNTSASYKF